MRSMVRYTQKWGGHVAMVVVVISLIVREGWIGVVVGPFAVLLVVMDHRHVEPEVPCGKCSHRKDDHNGNCQECLREQVRGELARDVPCSRFGRGSKHAVAATGTVL